MLSAGFCLQFMLTKMFSVCCPSSQNQPLHPIAPLYYFKGMFLSWALPYSRVFEQLSGQVLFSFVLCFSFTGVCDVSGLPGTACCALGVSVTLLPTRHISNLQAHLGWGLDGLFQKGAAEFCSRLNGTDSGSCSQWDTEWRDSNKSRIKYWCGFPGKFLPRSPYGRWSIMKYYLDCLEIRIRLFPNKICPRYSHGALWRVSLQFQCGMILTKSSRCHRLPSYPSFQESLVLCIHLQGKSSTSSAVPFHLLPFSTNSSSCPPVSDTVATPIRTLISESCV